MIGYLHGVLHLHIENIEFLSAVATQTERTRYTKEKLIADCQEALSEIKEICGEYDLVQSKKYIDDFSQDLDATAEFEKISHELTTIAKLVKQEAGGLLIFCIDREKSKYFEKNMPIWVPIVTAFPSADAELV